MIYGTWNREHIFASDAKISFQIKVQRFRSYDWRFKKTLGQSQGFLLWNTEVSIPIFRIGTGDECVRRNLHFSGSLCHGTDFRVTIGMVCVMRVNDAVENVVLQRLKGPGRHAVTREESERLRLVESFSLTLEVIFELSHGNRRRIGHRYSSVFSVRAKQLRNVSAIFLYTQGISTDLRTYIRQLLCNQLNCLFVASSSSNH